ncbi:Exportin-T [Coniochaeta sp. 2T2.1]|nr:Exportin-T [Coniochaeta sp. 2T2.1]
MANSSSATLVLVANNITTLQVANAIEIAFDKTSDQALKQQAIDYITQVRTDPQGWQVGASLFTQTPKRNEAVRLVALQIVDGAVSGVTQSIDGSSLVLLKDSLLDYVRRTYKENAGQDQDSAPLQNKLAQTLTYLFVSLYKSGWENFVGDLLDLTTLPNSNQRNNLAGVIFYLRTLGSVHDEIADILVVRQGPESRRNTELKDLLRERDVPNIANSWRELLGQYSNENDKVVELTLKVMGKWVSWIDISLVINQDMMSLLMPLVGRTDPSGAVDRVRDAAIDALNEIVSKKMKPADKTGLIDFLKLREIISELIASPPLHQFKGTPKYDTDLGEAVAKLVNTILTDIIRVLEDGEVAADTRGNAERQLRDFLPALLHFFSDEYDEICSTVIPSLTDLLTFLRRVGTLPPAYTEMLTPILNAIIQKTRYDETSSWGAEDEETDEAEFHELRKKLQNLQKSVAAVDQNLYIEVLSNLVASTFTTLDQQGGQMDWRDLDLALHEMYLFGELALPNAGLAAKSQPTEIAQERLAAMMSKMVESGIANFQHPAIILQYMEICVRYCIFFDGRHEYIPQVLEHFIRFVHHQHVRIRTRSWYLFMKFVKHLRAQVGNVAETVIQSIADLLPIKAELGGDDDNDDMSGSDAQDNSADAVFNSQLFLFEAIGCISSTGSIPAEKQALYARLVMDPLFRDMEQHLPRAAAGDAQAMLQIHHIIMALGTLANGFSDWHPGSSTTTRPPPSKEISAEFQRAAEAILVALNQLNSNAEIRTACRSAFSRLLSVLGSAVLPQLPQWIEGLLSQSSSKDEMAMFLRLLDQVRVFSGLAEPNTGTDDEIQLEELRREFLNFIQIIFVNELGGVLVSATNQHFFETLIGSIITLCKTIGHRNLVASRIGFNVLSKMAQEWGGPDVATISAKPTPPTGSPTPAFQGFDQFMIEHFHTACWEVLQDPQFKPSSDAQSRQVLSEIAGLEQILYTKTGDVFIQHLQTVTLPNLGIDSAEFLRHLTTGERKTFMTYLQNLLKSRR